MADHGRDPVDLDALMIRVYPDPVLRRKAMPLPEITDETRKVVSIMQRIMREEEGIGLAAPQVGLSWRMFIVHVPKDPKAKPPREDEADLMTHTHGLVTYINPVLTKPAGPVERFEEGCLSLPNISGDVIRPRIITIEATGLDGTRFTQRAAGLLARCWQHEMDHLDGVLIIDKMLEGHLAKNKRFIRDLEEGTAR